MPNNTTTKLMDNQFKIGHKIPLYSYPLVKDYSQIRQRKESSRYLYVFYSPLTGFSKIGRATDKYTRQKSIETSQGCKIYEIMYWEPEVNYDESVEYLEKWLHDFYKEKKVRGEWFSLSISDFIQIQYLFWYIGGEYFETNFNEYFKSILTRFKPIHTQ